MTQRGLSMTRSDLESTCKSANPTATDTENQLDTSTQQKLIAVDFDPFAAGEILLTVPSTESQREIWLSVKMGPEASCSFNESISLQITGPLDVGTLQQALQLLVDRHDALRTTFSADGSTLCVTKSMALTVPILDLSAQTNEQRDGKLQNLLDAEVEVPFDLEQGPLVRAQIVKLAKQTHRLLFSAHHIVCDGWAMSCVIRDLGHIYTAIRNDTIAHLSDPYKFSDYALLEAKEKQHNANANVETYWLNLYASGAPVTDLPTDRPRPATRTYDGHREDLELGPELVSGLKRIGGQSGATLFTVLLAGFEAYLCRITGQSDLVVGIPAAGQSATGRTTLVGHCVNILPLRGQIDSRGSFSSLLESVRSAMLDAYENQRYTFGSLIQTLPQTTRDPSRIPLIPILFNIDQATNEDGFPVEGINAEFSANPRHFENFEITLNVSSSADRVVFQCTYNTNLFDTETIRSRLREYEALLQSVTQDPDQAVNLLPVLTTPERRRLLHEWNATDQAGVPSGCLHQLIEAQVERTPDSVAVGFGQQQLSYRQLDQQANQLAHHLQSLGVGPDLLVGVCLERSEQMLIAVLGILKAGGAYLPMDPEYPKERLAYMAEHSGMSVLVTESALVDRLPDYQGALVRLDRDQARIDQLSGDRPAATAQPDHLAYVIYTSGSTGKPKGVQVPHSAVVNFLASMAKVPGIAATDKLLAVTTLSFDIAVLELYLPLTVGAQVEIASREATGDGDLLLTRLLETGATVMQATPATWRMLIAAGWQGSPGFKVLAGGEALPRDLVNELIDLTGGVWNMYGPTETTVWSTCEQITAKEGPVLIGRPIGNTQVYVLDPHRQPVPIGVPGELYIGGDGVTRGYLHAPELTAERFVQHPFSDDADAHLYRTGDQVKYHRDGRLEYLSRLDNQVKIRGFRIELGEIESALVTHPAVREAVTSVREERPGDARLAAYIVTNPGQEITITEVRKHLRSSLPEYMIPQHLVELDALPMTPNGKVDRNALPSPMVGGHSQADDFVAPTTDTEKTIAAIWQQVLDREQVGIHDNFFDLGGHSLLSIQVIAQINAALEVRVTPRDMLFNSLSHIAAKCDQENQLSTPQGNAQSAEHPSPGLFSRIRKKITRG